jgi:hypothetical protein
MGTIPDPHAASAGKDLRGGPSRSNDPRVTREAPAKRRRERANRRAVCEAGKDV